MSGQFLRNGFTLIELMVTLAVLAIVATVAVPSFQNLIENNRLATEANRIFAAMSYARSEAVRVGDDVNMTAETGGFSNGWCIHTGANCAGADVLRQFEGSDVAYAASGNQLSFNARGEMTNANFQIAIEPSSCDTGEVDKRRAISVSLSGRASIQKGNCT